MKKTFPFGIFLIALLWLALCLALWFAPRQETSLSERRPLAQMPPICAESLLSGEFMADFEDFTLDQFPLRDTFRSVKALFSRYFLGNRDNNGIYTAKGHIAELSYPLDTGSAEHALKQFQLVKDLYLDETNQVFTTVVPDKSYYLAPESGHLSMDHQTLFSMVEAGMPWAEYISLTDSLTLEDYYRTDTHWKQESLLPVAEKIGDALGIQIPTDYHQTPLTRPFYGVYYGQAALPMEPDTLYLLENQLLDNCRVYNFVTDSYGVVYDLSRESGNDPYEVYLSGAQSLLRIENPAGQPGRNLILFRDSFGSSLAPLLVADYATVTLIDIRYIQPQLLDRYVDFSGADVLFMYSSLVLNKNLI